jgi:hypothetical protein
MPQIQIIEDKGLSERSGRISMETWKKIKSAKGNSAFFPDGDQILMVSSNPFEPQYLLFAVNDDAAEDTLYVSSDVKASLYKDKETLPY